MTAPCNPFLWHRSLRAALCLFSATVLGGCASIVSTSNYEVEVTSEPSDVRFTVADEDGNVVHTGTTPETVKLRASLRYFDRQRYQIIAITEDDAFVTTDIGNSVDPWYFGNLLFGGPIGLILVDPLTGDMFKLAESASFTLPGTAQTTEAAEAAEAAETK